MLYNLVDRDDDYDDDIELIPFESLFKTFKKIIFMFNTLLVMDVLNQTSYKIES